MTTQKQADAVLADTAAVAEFMTASEQVVRTTPTTDIPDDERLLRARLVLEEALEFVAAMGCRIRVDPTTTRDGITNPKTQVDVSLDPEGDIDLIEAADAIADIVVVAKGSAHTLGIPVDQVFEAVHITNMSKMPGGKPIRRESDGKILKPPGWEPPTTAIRALLAQHSEVKGPSQ